MKFVLLSDIHGTSKNPIARKDFLQETFKSKLRFVFEHAQRIGAVILQAGDLSHKPRDWTVLDILIDTFNEFPNVAMYSVMGQHDSYMRSSLDDAPTSMSVLVKTKKLWFLSSEPIKFVDNVYVYGASWRQKWTAPKGKKNIMVAHYPVAEKAVYPGHKFFLPEDVAVGWSDFNVILVGDVHRLFFKEVDNTYIVNTGPMLRREGDKYNFKHRPCFFVWDSETETMEKVEIPHEPAEKVLTRTHLDNKKKNIKTIEDLEEVIHQIRESNLEGPKIKEILSRIMEEYGASRKVRRIIAEVMIDES
jgi:predicted phosphodiesterase